MGVCTTCRTDKRNKFLQKNLITEEKQNKSNNDNKTSLKPKTIDKLPINLEGITKASSESSTLHKIKPEIYSIEKFGVKVKLKQMLNEPLKFVFHFYNFKCKRLTENTIYIMNIIFDGKEYPLSFGVGNNPSFIFDEYLGKEITFNKMSSSFMEISIYTHKNKTKNVQFFKNMTKGEILAGTQIFSCLKIDLLTLALAPEKHDIILLDPKRKRVELGRINYNLSCKQVEDITIKIKSFKMNLKNLNYNEIALNLKYENANLSIIKETDYTENFHGTPNIKDNSMTYQYIHDEEKTITSKTYSNNSNFIPNINKEIPLHDKVESNKKILDNDEEKKDIFFDDMEEYDNKSISERLKLHGKMSLYEILNSEISLNIFSVGLKSRTDLDKTKDNNVNLNNTQNMPKPIKKRFSMPRFSIETREIGIFHKKLDLIKTYQLIGIVSLNFYKILYNNESKLEREASKFFNSISSQKFDELNKTISQSKINTVGIEKNLNGKKMIDDYDKENKDNNIIQNIIISAYEDVNQIFTGDIVNYDGESIGNIEIYIEIIKLPLIKQTMFGVLTETGFEINSIFLYDNNNISNDLPLELIELIKLKEKFEQEISTNIQHFDFDKNLSNIMINIKSTLEKSNIEGSNLYYGYSSNNDIYHAQEVMLDLGLILFELIDKLSLEHRKIGFEILKLILKRSEIDLGILSVRWFKAKRKSVKINLNINNINNNNKSNLNDFEFMNNYLLERGIIEKFFKFHLEALNFSLANLIKKKKDNESRNFTNYYLSISYFLNPMFREELIKQIYSSINFKDEKYLKYAKKNIINFNDEDNLDKTQSNFILWDISFYKKLESSLSKFSMKNINNNNFSDKYIKNINAIKEKLSEIKYITSQNDKKEDSSLSYSEHNWKAKIKERGFIFYDYILELLNYILEILNKIDENNINTKWTNIPGINKILEVINYDLIIKDAKNYPKQIYEILPIFYSEISIINNFINSMIINTNIYDTLSIFALLNILDNLFNKEYLLNKNNKNTIKDKIDYKIIFNSFLAVIRTENSLAIAKYIWFYYKNISVLSVKHVNKVITHILMPSFFMLFFHWSFQIRDIFNYFLIYIINHKIKKFIRPNKKKEKIEKSQNIFGIFNEMFGLSKNNSNSINDNKDDNKEEGKEQNNSDDNLDNKIYFFGDLLKEKLTIIEEIIKIVENEKYDIIYNDKIDINKFKNIINNIPEEYYSNIIVGIFHYKKIINEFKEWDKNIKENKIEDKKIVYPYKDIMIMKDDTIQYNN